MNLILSAGMPRSGSTWLYNALRLILKQDPRVSRSLSAGWVGDILKLPRERTMLIKIHDFEANLARTAQRIVYSYRDPRRVLLSLQVKFGQEPRPELVDYLMGLDRDWRPHAHLILAYEKMMQDQAATLAQLAELLKLPETDLNAVLHELKGLSFDSAGAKGDYQGSRFHRENLFHEGHITESKEVLSPSVLDYLERRYGDWMRAQGYF